MDKNKITIIALIAIIAALLVVMVAMMPNLNKQNTKLTFEGDSTIAEGDSIKIKLSDDNGNALTDQFVNVTITDENKASDYHSVITDDDGIGTFTIDKKTGNYTITVTYGGNESYAGCNATKKITIKEETAEVTQSSSSSTNNGGSSSSSETPRYTTDRFGTYDNERDVYVGGQFDGSNRAEVQEFDEIISRDGAMV